MHRQLASLLHSPLSTKIVYGSGMILFLWIVVLHSYLLADTPGNDNASTSSIKVVLERESINAHFSMDLGPDLSESFNISTTYEPPFTPGAFIHIGKTAGSTLSKQLRNGCHSFRDKPCYEPMNESHISKLTTYYHIPDFDNGVLYNNSHAYSFFVITLRDPLERTISAYLFSHPENRIAWLRFESAEERRLHPEKHLQKLTKKQKDEIDDYRRRHVFFKDILRFKCFPSLKVFAKHVGEDPDDYIVPFNRTNCTNYARAIFHNYAKGAMVHLYWNYDLITSMMRLHDFAKERIHQPKILVIRRENVWSDWTSANNALGQDDVTVFDADHSVYDRSKLQLPINGTDLSLEGRLNLCRAIANEYDIYFELLQRAENLNDEDIQTSFMLAKKNCPNIDIKLPSKK